MKKWTNVHTRNPVNDTYGWSGTNARQMSPVSLDERISWARNREAEARHLATQNPNDRLLAAAYEGRKREHDRLLDTRDRLAQQATTKDRR